MIPKEVEFTIQPEQEDTPVHGNAVVSGDKDKDREVENRILKQLESGDLWAWCTVKVTARYKGFEGHDYLGCCSYKDEADFRRGGYFEGMKQAAYDDLIHNLDDAIHQGERAEQLKTHLVTCEC